MSDTTGGLRWHLRAFWQRRRWALTTKLLADWLDDTEPLHSELLLIGGSAGWMMSGRWLQRFKRVILVDIDTHAPRLFRFNHGRALRASGSRLEFLQCDAMTELESLLVTYPQATIFFDNVLGQHLFRLPDLDSAEQDLKRIARRLQGRDWGSVHDVFSGTIDPAKLPASPIMSFNACNSSQGLTVDTLLGTALHNRLLSQVGACEEWMDHLTSELFPTGTHSRLISWPFRPDYTHWLQAGWVSPQV